ncbi:MAG: hypothetical protein U0975_15885 [Erythrobacter sp.]|nr:hypothetical protein [Erythrobacter sp.]MDZ4274140.1 hypothetical protein [Erythrobacter sp.]
MSLLEELQRARTEEDVKDAYIKALGLKGVFKGLVDIQTPEIWFEAKEAATPPLLMFAQLLTYVRAARKRGEAIPGFLCVIDREKAALMATEHALPILEDKSIVWPKSGSAADKALAAQIAPTIETHFVLYQIDGYEAEFIKAASDAVREGRIIRTPITPNNLRQVFDKWVAMVGVELGVKNEADYAVLFFADIMHDGTNEAMRNLPARLLFSGDKPVFIIGADQYELASERGYRNFWNIYHRPPEQKHRHYLLERRDSLLPMDDQKFKGAFYTPLHIVDKAYDQLNATLGADWQQKYIVWDMCAGVGNLEAKHSNLRNVFMSTLDQEDVTIMRSNPAFAGAEIFQYDYLNDDVTDFGEIDYALSGKVPQALRQAIADARDGKRGAKPILVLINPPYAEATNDNTAKGVASDGSGAKERVAKTRLAVSLKADYGKATNELFAQFVARIDLEIPTATLAMFSTLKYVISPTLEQFRKTWQAKFLSGFVVHSRAFDGVPGNFPIAFFVWDTSVNVAVTDIETRVLDKDGQEEGEKKFVTSTGRKLLTDWIVRPRSNREQVVPLKNALTTATATKDLRGTRWSDGAVAYMWCNSNDLQQANKTALFSSGFNGGHGLFVNSENLWQAAIVFSVRRLIKPTWLNDRDQFLQPSQPLSDTFKSDCLVWMLFNGSNLTAGADGLRWNDRDWSLTNHFIPYTEAEVGAKARFESDFMVRYMQGMAFSPEATAVLDEGRKLFQRFHAMGFPNKIREEYKLNRADAGWYQVRRALEAYGDIELTDFDPFKSAYAALTAKLRPMVYELGFLPE